MKRSALLALLLTVGTGAAAFAQGGPPQGAPPAGMLRGSVLDAASNRPLASATVSLWSARDSSLVTGALTRPDGSFQIEGLRPGAYYVKFDFIGYRAHVARDIAIRPDAARVDLGAVKLEVAAVAVDGVTATTERSEVVAAPDRNVYNVRNLPSTAGGNAVDVLRNVPAVEVDIDGKPSLRGNQNVAVQINGRAAPMRGDQLGQFLQGMSANMIERVEVIPNPSAKHDPEGMAGILNIVLKQNADLGTSGGVVLGGGTTDRINLSGNLGHQQGALTLFGSYAFFSDTRAIDLHSLRQNLFVQPSTYLEQDGAGEQSPLSHTLTATAEYKLNRRDLLSTSLMAAQRGFEIGQTNVYSEQDAGRNEMGGTRRRSSSELTDGTIDYALSLKRTFEPRRHELQTEVRLVRSDVEIDNLFSAWALDGARSAASTAPARETSMLNALSYQWTAQADYTRPFGKETKLETGYKGTLRTLDNDFAVHSDAGTGRFSPVPGRSNAFGYDEQVHAVYGVLSRTRGRLDLQGGLRVEQALTDFRLENTGERFDNDYTSLFPSAIAAFNVSQARQLKASYSKRVQRPDTRLLNPFAFYEDPLTVQVGNPYLTPEYTHAFELGFQQTGPLGMLQVTPFFRHTVDAIRGLRTVSDEGVTTTTLRNYATSDSYGADVTASFRKGAFNGFTGGNFFRQVTDGSGVDGRADVETFGWAMRASTTWRISPKLDAQSFLMYRAPMTTEMGRMSALTMTHFAVRQKLMGEKANLSLRVVDPFDQMRFALRSSDLRHVQETERRFGARGAYLTFSYNFGQQPRIRQRPPQEQGEQMPSGGLPIP